MIVKLQSVVTHIDEVIENFTNSRDSKVRAVYGSCSWLDENLDRLIEIGNDTSKKTEIYQIENDITEVQIDMSSCSQTHINALKEHKVNLYQIICHMKERIGMSCASTFSSMTSVTSMQTFTSVHTTSIQTITPISSTTIDTSSQIATNTFKFSTATTPSISATATSTLTSTKLTGRYFRKRQRWRSP